jgi:asparagine synthase (glutamine-hydrolysing)
VSISTEATLKDQFIGLLESSIDLRLRADVPIAISLSGGLDSSVLAALVARRNARLQAFSFGDRRDSSTEGPLAAKAADAAGMSISFTHDNDNGPIDLFRSTLRAQGAPFADLSVVAQFAVFQAARQAGYKVLLGGQGADEILMGYRKFQLILIREAAAAHRPLVFISRLLGASMTMLAEARRLDTYMRQRRRYLSRSGLKSRLSGFGRVPDLNLAGSGATATDRQIDDVLRLSLPTLLRYEDRNSMGNSLETRLPYLDYRVAELAVALPNAMKVRGGYGKAVLRDVARNLIPHQIAQSRIKRGFDVRRRRWLEAGLGSALREELSAAGPEIRDMLPAGSTIAHDFSNERLANDPSAFVEATTLLWLAGQ